MSGFMFTLTCLGCGNAEVEVVASGKPMASEVSAVVECAACGSRWQVLVRLLCVDRDPQGAARRRRSRGRVSA